MKEKVFFSFETIFEHWCQFFCSGEKLVAKQILWMFWAKAAKLFSVILLCRHWYELFVFVFFFELVLWALKFTFFCGCLKVWADKVEGRRQHRIQRYGRIWFIWSTTFVFNPKKTRKSVSDYPESYIFVRFKSLLKRILSLLIAVQHPIKMFPKKRKERSVNHTVVRYSIGKIHIFLSNYLTVLLLLLLL